MPDTKKSAVAFSAEERADETRLTGLVQQAVS